MLVFRSLDNEVWLKINAFKIYSIYNNMLLNISILSTDIQPWNKHTIVKLPSQAEPGS